MCIFLSKDRRARLIKCCVESLEDPVLIRHSGMLFTRPFNCLLSYGFRQTWLGLACPVQYCVLAFLRTGCSEIQRGKRCLLSLSLSFSLCGPVRQEMFALSLSLWSSEARSVCSLSLFSLSLSLSLSPLPPFLSGPLRQEVFALSLSLVQ